MTFPETVSYIDSLANFEKFLHQVRVNDFDLSRVERLLSALGDPQKTLRCVHVAGSKGKGSVCAMLAAIGGAAGYRVGLYTSPHMFDVRERIRLVGARYAAALEQPAPMREALTTAVSGHGVYAADLFPDMIRREDFARVMTLVKSAGDGLAKKGLSFTFFEVMTAAAFVYFVQQQVDLVVLETGLGGRLDATNAADALVSVVTPISLEHTAILGETVAAIAGEKAGIIKPGAGEVVIGSQPDAAREVLIERCLRWGKKWVDTALFQRQLLDLSTEVTRFSLRSADAFYEALELSLIGKHQMDNAAAAIGAVEALNRQGFSVAPEHIRSGLLKTKWPGRFEIFSRDPYVILDAAHNADSARVLAETFSALFPGAKATLVIGLSADKDSAAFCRVMDPIAEKIVATKSRHPRARAFNLPALASYFSDRPVILTAGVADALDEARRDSPKYILVTGSVFVVAEARASGLGAGI
ncbi:MAG: bifunctional folylpolyglutamate synthase/dihydrofolate synthase [Candidatus Omnitrophica bacterium]|nr:bifunctional folylpolyglutamate synthase/dihydrofolate synthase [Candidatus Omnitrophota bacterium]